MAIQILPPNPSLSSTLGSALGTGLSGMLENLAQQKAQEMQTQQVIPALQQLGYTPEQAMQLAPLSTVNPRAFEQIIKSKMNEPYEQGLMQLFGGAPNAQQQVTPEGQPQQPAVVPKIRAQDAMRLAQLQEAKQQNIIKENKPYLDSLEKRADVSREIADVSQTALELLNARDANGKRLANVGAIGSYIPLRWQNDTTQKLSALFNRLVSLYSQRGKGVPSRMRILLEQAAKADLWQKPETIEFILERMARESFKDTQESRIAEQLVEKSGGRQPQGLKSLAARQMKKIEKLPDPLDYSVGARILDPAGKNIWKRTLLGWEFEGKAQESPDQVQGVQ